MSQDFGEGRHIVGRKPHHCIGCYGPIPKGETHFQWPMPERIQALVSPPDPAVIEPARGDRP